MEENQMRKREFCIQTPLGEIRVMAKHQEDDPDNYPGVYVDLLGQDGEYTPLVCVEYDNGGGVFKDGNLCVDVYDDAAKGAKAAVSHRIVIENIQASAPEAQGKLGHNDITIINP